ncbi:hypothetical protein TanjilG_21810 [Lupinus angustifolius]|uniref:Peptidase A1 domain-containing protein n=1 Tax=Lupinus angustifolius TaxID=3871 RepID=A0A394DBY5_LUPAN|nr:hypothetical protein TanjilG_21810 [Lupinus angustifolius]
MDLNIKVTLLLLFILAVEFCFISNANFVLPVQRKFKVSHKNLTEIKAHDTRRHGRFLSAVDIEIGGNGLPSKTGLYYTKIGLGSPVKDFYVQVDTGSDILWVNCGGCTTCPKKSGLGMELHLYDSKDSTTSEVVPCDGDFCHATYEGQISDCKQGKSCPYSIIYGDGGQTTGSFVKDLLTFNRVSGNLHTGPDNSSIVFGCGSKQTGSLGKPDDDALGGIMGFGQSNSSMLSQLAASGKCVWFLSLFGSTNLIQWAHYNVVLKDVEVDGDLLQLPLDIFDSGNGRGTIIDSGTTLVYLPPMIHSQLVSKILARQPTLKLYLVEDEFTCFQYSDKLDDGFPLVKFHFDGISLIAYPHDYLFYYRDDMYCIGWQKSSSQTKDGKDLILLGDLVLSNKLVVYDLENMEIGWTDFNCSSSIKVKDDKTGSVYAVGAHQLNSASTVLIGIVLPFFLLLIIAMITV